MMGLGCIVGKIVRYVLSSFIWIVTKYIEDLHAFTCLCSLTIRPSTSHYFFFFHDEIDFLKLEMKRNLDLFLLKTRVQRGSI